jgi:hypothetical protein
MHVLHSGLRYFACWSAVRTRRTRYPALADRSTASPPSTDSGCGILLKAHVCLCVSGIRTIDPLYCCLTIHRQARMVAGGGNVDDDTGKSAEIPAGVVLQSSSRAAIRRSAYARWILFGVLLPLLPIAAKIAASWFDVGHPTWDYRLLFGTGDVLVLAVVVAAAGIGDLLFAARNNTHVVLREALVISLALIVMVLSGVAYGLVTLKQESHESLASVRLSTVDTLQAQLTLAQQNVDTAAHQTSVAQTILNQAQVLYAAEITGQKAPGTTGVPGKGVLAYQYNQRISSAKAGVAEARRREASARAALIKTSSDLSKAVRDISQSRSINTKQTATASLVLFAAGILVVGTCIWVGTDRPIGGLG